MSRCSLGGSLSASERARGKASMAHSALCDSANNATRRGYARRSEPKSQIKHVFLLVSRRLERGVRRGRENYMARRAGERAFARALELDAARVRYVQEVLARAAADALRATVRVNKIDRHSASSRIRSIAAYKPEKRRVKPLHRERFISRQSNEQSIRVASAKETYVVASALSGPSQCPRASPTGRAMCGTKKVRRDSAGRNDAQNAIIAPFQHAKLCVCVSKREESF